MIVERETKMQIPKLAVIIPCYNEELCVESTSKRLLEVLSELVQKGKNFTR